MSPTSREFYNRNYQEDFYASRKCGEKRTGSYAWLESMAKKYNFSNKRCLEVGSGRGQLQELVPDYFGVDFVKVVKKYYHKPFTVGEANCLPFISNSFDVVWTLNVLEHVPEPDVAFDEIKRVLQPGGLLFLSPAWFCRPWAAEGYKVRPYSDFDWHGKLIKLTIPVQDSILFRSSYVFPRRLIHYFEWKLTNRPTVFRYGKLKPNYEQYWISDSDAVNSMDPYDAYLWFRSRGDICLSHPSELKAFFVRTGGLIFKVS